MTFPLEKTPVAGGAVIEELSPATVRRAGRPRSDRPLLEV
jgi:hypothetical protein